jgi:hypothetical protein
MKTVSFLLLYLFVLPLWAQTPVSITLDSAGSFRVTGWSEAARLTSAQWPQLFTVQVDVDGVPGLLGSYSLDGEALVFRPAYPLQPGVSYRAILKIPYRDPIIQRIQIPRGDATPTTSVEHVYPSIGVLPENQLKFYIHFSASMSRGEAYRRIHLLDQNGSEVPRPFLELTEELWDQEYRRFTLLFDPGRIKRGLVPHNELGAPIEAGRKYTLVIDSDWLDANNNPLKEGFKKGFSVGPADRSPLNPSTWHVLTPQAKTSDPIVLEFSEPLDRALLERELEVIDASASRVEGAVTIEGEETRWKFTPTSAWRAGNYSVRLGMTLADLAGNMIDHPFEIDVFEKVDERVARQTREIAFEVK